MNAEELYQAIKDALNALDVEWKNKDKVTVTFTPMGVQFFYKNKAFTTSVKGQIQNILRQERIEAFHAGYTSRPCKLTWRDNPCEFKNMRGHSDCKVCEMYSKAIFPQRKKS